MRVFVLVLLVACCVSAQWSSSSWTDVQDILNGGYGGTLYLCVEGDDVQGAYSEFGLVQGKVDNNVIAGYWYEAGASGCDYGTFQWRIAEDGLSFTGGWSCADDDEEYEWTETYLGDASTTDEIKCAVLGSQPVAGSSSAGDVEFDICFNDDKYFASFSFEEDGDTVVGYEAGDVFAGGVIASGSYLQSDRVEGASLVFRLRDGTLGNYYWDFSSLGLLNTLDLSTHGFDILTTQRIASDQECSAYNFLAVQQQTNDDDDDSSSDSTSSSSASMLLCPFLLIAVASLF